MNHDLHFAYQIKRHLNQSLHAFPADKAERLRAAREQALALQKRPVNAVPLASTGSVQIAARMAADGASSLGATGDPGGFGRLAHLVPVFVLAAGLIGISYWHQNNRAQENADIDTQMLIDELPPSAYADKGFVAWIKRGQE